MKNIKRMVSLFLSGIILFSLVSCSLKDKVKEISGFSDASKIFQIALENKNVELLNEVIKEYPDYDINKCEQGSSLAKALFNNGGRATDYENITFSRAMLDAGADPNVKSTNGDYLLITTCDNDFYWATELLVEYGADLEVKNDLGYSPLYLVMANFYGDSEENRIKTAKFFVDKGAAVTTDLFNIDENKDEDLRYHHIGASPVVSNYLMNILHEKGEETNMPKAMEYAISGDLDKTIEYIEKGEALTDKEKELVFDYASYFGMPDEFETICRLTEMQIDNVNMERIIQCGNLDMIQYLIEKCGFKLQSEKVSPSQENYLKLAVLFGYSDIFDYLCNHNAYNPGASVLLESALYNGNLDLFKKVYEYEAQSTDITELNEIYNLDGYYLNGKLDFIDYLMSEKNHTFECYSFKNIDFETARYLYEKGRPLNITDLDYAICHNDIEYIQLVLDKGADINQKCYSFDYSNYVSNYKEQVSQYDNFTSKHIYYESITEKNKELPTAFSYLLNKCNSECIKFMIENGAEIPDDILIYASEASKAVNQILFDNNANTNIDFSNVKGVMRKDYSLEKYYRSIGRSDLLDLL